MPDMHLGDAFHIPKTHMIGGIAYERDTKLLFQRDSTVGKHQTHATASIENKLMGAPLYLHRDDDSATTKLDGDGVTEVLLLDTHLGEILSIGRQHHAQRQHQTTYQLV